MLLRAQRLCVSLAHGPGPRFAALCARKNLEV